jgi:cytoskeletal protein RodZ
MKSLRALVLMLAVGTFSGFLMQAHAQQEVDPDHFDQAVAQAKAQSHHKATAAQNQHHSNVKLASKHSAAKSHHHAHVAA